MNLRRLLGLTAAWTRTSTSADAITDIETTSSDEVLLHVGAVSVERDGSAGRVHSERAIRLTADDVADLIDALTRVHGLLGVSR